MPEEPDIDVLIFEDTPGDVGRIIHWFGLDAARCKAAAAFPAKPPSGATADQGALILAMTNDLGPGIDHVSEYA